MGPRPSFWIRGQLQGLIELFPNVSQRKMHDWTRLNRSTTWRHKTNHNAKVIDLDKVRQENQLVEQIKELVQTYPTWGYRRIWAWLRHKQGMSINRKKVYRIMREQGWQARKIIRTPRPRVQDKRSVVSTPNTRWAIDATSLWSKNDGWIGLMAVIDCCTRQIVGYELAKRGRAIEASAALEEACLAQFGLVYPKQGDIRPMLRSDNGKVFTSKLFVARCKQYGLEQEFTTPYCPQQNGMIERFFRTLKEECVWQHNFESFSQAKTIIGEFIDFYNNERLHQSLGYLSPADFSATLSQHVA